MTSRFVLTGMSGTGKSVLLEALGATGATCFEEVPRKLLQDQVAVDGPALPSTDPGAFVSEMLDRSLSDFDAAAHTDSIAFYDRGIPDVIAYAQRFGVATTQALSAAKRYRYADPVFVAPPWPEIFEQDEFRKASYNEYVVFHQLIVRAYEEAGYTLLELPRVAVA